MKLSLTQDNLHKALAAVGRVVGSRTSLPVLANVLLTTDANRLRLSTTNLEIGINYWVGAKVEREGSITVPARLLAEYIANLPPETLHLEVEKQILHVSAQHNESHMNGIDAEEFPSIPVVASKLSLKLDAQDLKKALTQVVLVASSDEARPVLGGVYIYSEKDQLILAATDSYRLAEKKLKLAATPKTPIKVIVPARTINELLRMIGDDQEEVEMIMDDNQVLFKIDSIELISRLIDGQFPDYRQLIPKESQASAAIKTSEFIQITKVASLFAQESASSVTVSTDVKAQTLSLRSIASQVGDNVSTVSATLTGDNAEVALNCRYILDALSVVDSEEVSFSITGKVNPCILQPSGESDYLHIIMPLRS